MGYENGNDNNFAARFMHHTVAKKKASAPSAAYISDGGVGGSVYRGTNFTTLTETADTVVQVSFWWKPGAELTGDMAAFEFWYSVSSGRYSIYWSHALQAWRCDFAQDGGGGVTCYLPKALIPAGLVDGNGRPKPDLWTHWSFSLTGADGSDVFINGENVGNMTDDGYPLRSNVTNTKGRIGEMRNVATAPIANGGGICQLRFHQSWANRSTFLNSDPARWMLPINVSEETELWMGWPLSADANKATTEGADFTLMSGAFTEGAGPELNSWA